MSGSGSMRRVWMGVTLAIAAISAWPAWANHISWWMPGTAIALFLVLVSGMFAAGVALQGGFLWPGAEELQGSDALTVLMMKAGTALKLLAGGPYLLAAWCGYAQTALGGRLHEYGTTLLTMAGLLNLLAMADAWELRKAAR